MTIGGAVPTQAFAITRLLLALPIMMLNNTSQMSPAASCDQMTAEAAAEPRPAEEGALAAERRPVEVGVLAAQPFWLLWTTPEGKPCSHAPGLFRPLGRPLPVRPRPGDVSVPEGSGVVRVR